MLIKHINWFIATHNGSRSVLGKCQLRISDRLPATLTEIGSNVQKLSRRKAEFYLQTGHDNLFTKYYSVIIHYHFSILSEAT